MILQAPLIHLNGSSKARLKEDLAEAYQAIREASLKLHATAPHQRDYYPLPDGAWECARDQYLSRLKRLEEIEKELLAVRLAISEGKTEVEHGNE